MKNQYFGDVGDYGKYAMLRCLAEAGIRIAVNWYLTDTVGEKDGTNDGRFTTYLKKNQFRRFDPDLFNLLKDMVYPESKEPIGTETERIGQTGRTPDRSVLSFEEKDMIPGAVYYHELLTDDREARNDWHKKALLCCKDANMVFLDPDNGPTPPDTATKKHLRGKKSCKFCFPEEIADYYRQGNDVVYYCQKARRSPDRWRECKQLMLHYQDVTDTATGGQTPKQMALPDCRLYILTYHRGTQRSYIFVLHENHYAQYQKLLHDFCDRWVGEDGKAIFTEEDIN